MRLFQLKNLRLRLSCRFAALILICLVGADTPAIQSASTQATNLIGRWKVNFSLSGGGATNLEFQAHAKGSGSFLLFEPNNETPPNPLPATWSQTTNDRVNFSGEVELQFSSCCRETGTLIFKGKFKSSNTITGKVIFIGTTVNEDNFIGYTSTVGAFTATRVP